MYYHLDRRMVLFSLVDQSFDLNHHHDCRDDDCDAGDDYEYDEKIFFFDVSYDHDDDDYDDDASFPSFDDDGDCCYENDNDDDYDDHHDVENMK